MPLDHHRQWYRYHRLFSEALVAELHRREPAEESRVHLRAATWYEQQGMVEEAVAHRVAGGERHRGQTRRRVRNRIHRDRSDRHHPAVGAGARAGHASRLPASCRDCGLDGGALGGDRARAPPAADRRACVVPWPVAQRSCVAGRGDVTPARHDGSTGRRSGARRRPARARSRTAWQRWNALSATVLGVALLLRGDPEGDRAVRVRHAARPEARESARRGLGTAVRHYFRVPPTAIPWLAAQAAVAAPARSGCCPAELTSLR